MLIHGLHRTKKLFKNNLKKQDLHLHLHLDIGLIKYALFSFQIFQMIHYVFIYYRRPGCRVSEKGIHISKCIFCTRVCQGLKKPFFKVLRHSHCEPQVKLVQQSLDCQLQPKSAQLCKYLCSNTELNIWHLAIWQNWCFCHFYHSKIEVLQNCSAFLCGSFSHERKFERIERK